jgi:DNA polymerase family A
VRVALVAGPGQTGLMCRLRDDGTADQPPQPVDDLVGAVADFERNGDVRWVWAAATQLYPALLRSGGKVTRCHDVQLVGSLIRARDGTDAEPADITAAAARLAKSTVRAGEDAGASGNADSTAPTSRAGSVQLVFDHGGASVPDSSAVLADLIAVHEHQLGRIAADLHPARFSLLAAAESAGGLAAAEMTAAGLPWRADVHDQLLTEVLGPRPHASPGAALRPARLSELATQISLALGAVRPVNPDSPPQLLRALTAAGIRVTSTRSSVLRRIDHPAIPLLLEYKELARLHAANGWSWLDAWVSGGRFRPAYVVGGVVSGRWASRGGGALQIPKLLRRAVVADPGWVLVVADAAQLEPRILAALAGDRSFALAAASGDLYAAVADAIGADRATAKVALLSAMYGGTGGDRGQSLALLRRRFPQASAFVEGAARDGEEGRVVRSVLGRTCPPPSAAWLSLTSESGDPEQERDPGAGQAARARGRFTRNFVVQASAADWALVLLAGLRARLTDDLPADCTGAAHDLARQSHLVFFQHDEVIVHSPRHLAAQVVSAVEAAAAAATGLVFGGTEVSFPMTTTVVDCYADAK